MASEKNPSIYNDRSTIGSFSELDEYGVWVKSEPQDLSSADSGAPEFTDPSIPGIEDLPDFVNLEGEAEETDAPEDDFSFSDDDLPPSESTVDFEDLAEISMDDFLEDMPSHPDTPSFEEALAQDAFPAEKDISKTGVLDVSADFHVSPEEAPEAPAVFNDASKEDSPEKAESAAALSTQLLMQIASELSSIKTELSELKQELSVIRGAAPPREQAGAADGGGGFFDEEADEKIALTGDELDNIIHTADFTEEAGTDLTEGLADDFASIELTEGEEAETPPEIPLEIPPDDFTEIPLEETPEEPLVESPVEESPVEPPAEESPAEPSGEELSLPEEAAGEELSLPQDFSVEILPEDKAEEAISLPPEDLISIDDALGSDIELLDDMSLDLRQLRDEGVEPMTAPPEDTSYLEEDPLALDQDQFDRISLDLSGAVIDEPDLSGELQDNPIAEPSLDDISIDLDIEEPLLDEGEIHGFEETPPAGEPEEEILIDLPTEEFAGEAGGEKAEEALETGFEEPEEEPFDQVIPEGFEDGDETSSAALLDETLLEDDEPFAAELDAGTAEPSPEIQDEAGEGGSGEAANIPANLKRDLKSVLSYMDQLLESLPEEKIEEFAKSEYFDTYKKLFEELGIA
jgi:hypothetical protein